MSTEPLNSNIKTRVGRSIKKSLIAIADARHLTSADIQREAFRDLIAKPENQKLLKPEVKPA